jgi:hypothetical protein
MIGAFSSLLKLTLDVEWRAAGGAAKSGVMGDDGGRGWGDAGYEWKVVLEGAGEAGTGVDGAPGIRKAGTGRAGLECAC